MQGKENQFMKTAIVWFRNDLRIHDNEVLYRAAEKYDRVIPLYCLDETQLNGRAFGFRKMGPRRLKFILESLSDLQKGLIDLKSGLLIRKGSPAEIIADLVRQFEVSEVIVQKEVTREEIDQENAVQAALHSRARLKFYWGAALYHLNDLPFQATDLPDVFTAFRKKAETVVHVRSIFPFPKMPPLPEGLKGDAAMPTLADLGFTPLPIDPRAAIRFKGGETEALKRLQHFFWDTKSLSSYKITRNGLIGSDYSSKFSAWLSLGCLSPRFIYHQVKQYEAHVSKNDSTYWLIFELIWRDYFRFVAMKYGDKLFFPGGIKDVMPEVISNEKYMSAWTAGETGIPFVDANMRELTSTGFMSNRGRQNVVSFLIKDLKQDWRRGAAFFEQELIDYDVASNWGNWAYVAGVGNDPRTDRYFNVIGQAEKYDAAGTFVKRWIPELENIEMRKVHTPWKLSNAEKTFYGLHEKPWASPVMVPENW